MYRGGGAKFPVAGQEGTVMYIVESVLPVNTNPQASPNRTAQYAGLALTGKETTVISFCECLETLISQASATADKRAENQKVGVLMGYYMPWEIMARPEIKRTFNNKETVSEL